MGSIEKEIGRLKKEIAVIDGLINAIESPHPPQRSRISHGSKNTDDVEFVDDTASRLREFKEDKEALETELRQLREQLQKKS